MEPRGQARGPSISSAESAEAYPPAHTASEGYPFGIHPRLKPWPSAKADKKQSDILFFVNPSFHFSIIPTFRLIKGLRIELT